MAWTSPTIRAAGYLVTNTDWNTDLVNNLLYLHGDAGVVTTNNGFSVIQPSNGVLLQDFFLVADANPAFKIFTQGAMWWGAGGASAQDVKVARFVNTPGGTGSFLEMYGGDGLGYGAGTGGSVTQATSRNTGVTINKPTGQIITNGTSVAGGTVSTFVVTNSVVGPADVIVLSIQNNPATGPLMVPVVIAVGAGSFTISYVNNSGSASTAVLNINFAVIKGAQT